jgi:hypothetical protein
MKTQQQKDEAARKMREKTTPKPAHVEIPRVKHERHYKVREIAEDWQMSTDTVQKLFLRAYFGGEPGIIATTGPKSRYKITRHRLSISESARGRMYRSLQDPQAA